MKPRFCRVGRAALRREAHRERPVLVVGLAKPRPTLQDNRVAVRRCVLRKVQRRYGQEVESNGSAAGPGSVGRVYRRRAALSAAAVRRSDRPGAIAQALTNAIQAAASRTPICSPAPAASARHRRRASLPRRSTARKGRRPTPCDKCDICKAIADGEDVDVLEIDGASNRGSTRSAQFATTLPPGRSGHATRSTSSTKSTC